MPSKREHDAEDDFDPSDDDSYHGSPPKRARRQKVETAPVRTRGSRKEKSKATSHSHPSPQARTKPSHREHKAPSRSKAERLAAELANLADFNAPPKPRNAEDSDDEQESPPPRRTRKRESIKHGRVTKLKVAPDPSAVATKKRTPQDKLLAEVSSLELWPHWESEEEDSARNDDDDEDRMPRTHSRVYPPKEVGVQNIPWSSLPAEMRNTIYEYCMETEEKKVLTVIHYPDGIPRRSVRGVSTTTNFAHSFWGFTQTCKQVREELTPWLLSKRSVRTPLATLNNYVELFHRVDPVDGKRIGHIEPICTGAPLPGNGVEILALVKQIHHSSAFHLKLDPPSFYPAIEELQVEPDPNQWDEMTIFRDIEHLFATGNKAAIDAAGIKAIHVTSVACGPGENEEEEEEDSHDILIKLSIDKEASAGVTRDEQLKLINEFLFQSWFARKTGLRIQAKVAGGQGQWIVKAVRGMVMGWKTKRRGGEKVFRLLTAEEDELDGYTELDLE